jgi:hypothetical protein
LLKSLPAVKAKAYGPAERRTESGTECGIGAMAMRTTDAVELFFGKFFIGGCGRRRQSELFEFLFGLSSHAVGGPFGAQVNIYLCHHAMFF